MSFNANGLVYEQKVYDTLKYVNSEYLKVLGDSPSGGFNAHDTDMQLEFMGQKFDIEIKADNKAQMGGTSFTYDRETKLFESAKEISQTDKQLLLQEASSMTQNLDMLIDKIKTMAPVSYNSKNNGFPLATTKETWSKLQKEGYLIPLNTKIKRDASFIHEHYSKKNVNYIQIGGSGFFYLKDNPLNLPIPQLTGEIDIEFRPGRSGAKYKEYRNETYGFVGVGLRIQGRLKFKDKSPYTLDDPESIQSMLKSMNNLKY